MPRTCLACSSSERESIDKALVAGEPLRNIAKRVSISPAGLLRHKSHASQSIVKAAERREERLGDNLLEEMRRVQRKAWELLEKTESQGDHRGAIVALREVRECLETMDELIGKAGAEGGGPLSQWSNNDLKVELNRRGEPTEMVIRFGKGKDDCPCDRPCCTAARNEGSGSEALNPPKVPPKQVSEAERSVERSKWGPKQVGQNG